MTILINNINYELRTEENGAFVVECDYKGDIVIPAVINVEGMSVPVIGIAEEAFYACDDVTSITLPEGLKIIERNAFENMSGLVEIVIPESVCSIGDGALCCCENLQKVTLPSSIKHIPDNLLESCGSLKEIFLPKGVKSLGESCFAACVSLRKVVLPEGLEEIGSNVFSLCTGLEEVVIPATVKRINSFAFYFCSSLKSIILPDGLEYVATDCFGACESLVDVVLPSSVKMVEEGAFALTPYRKSGICYSHDLLVSVGTVDSEDGCLYIQDGTRVVCDTAVCDYDNRLRKVVCPASLRQIGRHAFVDSENLTEVVLNEGLECIDGGAFVNCKKLTHIYIPSTVRRIESGLFVGCDKLEKIVVSPDNPYFDSRENCNAIIETAGNRLLVACGKSIIPEDVVEIADAAFAGLETLEEITIPESVKKIQWRAFNSCSHLRKITFPKHLNYIGEDAFGYTAWFDEQPDGLVIIGDVLYKYKPINEEGPEPVCEIPEGVKEISMNAFDLLSRSMRIILPKSLTHYNPDVFVPYFSRYNIVIPPELSE